MSANASKGAVSVDRLREVLKYDPDTGVFTWLVSTSPKSKVGSVAGCVSVRGYRRICFDGKGFSANRAAWALTHGAWPDTDVEIDHINGDRADDRISNLRAATCSQNRANTRARGKFPKGVGQLRSSNFFAYISVNRSSKYLGSFTSVDEAAHAYNKAAIDMYGEFARINPVGVK